MLSPSFQTVFPILANGGKIRRASWPEGQYVTTGARTPVEFAADHPMHGLGTVKVTMLHVSPTGEVRESGDPLEDMDADDWEQLEA